MDYCIYLRKSRSDIDAELRGEGETLERHKNALLDLAKKQKIPITQIYSEIVSGESIAARPIIQTLLTEVEQGVWKGVLVMEVERLARGDTIDQGIVSQAFKYSNTKIITPMKIYDPSNEFDEEYFEFGLFMSRREYKVINRRLQSGRLASVKEGKYVGNKAPYGYIRKKLLKDKGYSLDINPDEAEIVKIIYNLYAIGEVNQNGTTKRLGVSLIARRLNDLKIKPQKGDVWTYATIKGILANPVYTGKIRWNFRPQNKKVINGQIVKERPRAKKEDWILVEGFHDSIITDEIWDKAQEITSLNISKPCPKDLPIKNPLSGLIICGICGRKMVRRPYYKKSYPDTLMCPIPSCNNVSSTLHLVEERLIQSLEQWCANYSLNITRNKKESENSKQSTITLRKKALKKLDSDIDNTDKQISNIYDLLEQGIYDINVFLDRSKKLSGRLIELKDQKQAIIDELEKFTQQEIERDIIIPKIYKIIELYKESIDPATKNELLHQLLDKAIYTKSKSGRWHADPSDFDLKLYPKLPRI